MEEEIDLRQYINVLIRYWYWIAGLALVAAVVAFVVSSFLPPTYEATSLVVVTQPRYQFQFDQRVENVPFDLAQFSHGYQTIATSDDLLLFVAKAASRPESPQDLDKMFSVEADGDPNLIKLTVRSRDPQEAAGLANVWAEQLAAYLNQVYGRNDGPVFEKQTAEAKTALEQTDLALATFRQKYGLGFFDSNTLRISGGDDLRISGSDSENTIFDLGIARRLRAKTDLLMQYETQADRTARLLQEARALSAQADSAASPAIVAGLLTDMLQLGLMDKESSLPVQINLGSLDARASLSALITALEAKQNSADEAITRLQAEVEALQSELADRQRELEQLLRDRRVAQDTYLTLSNKFQEASVQAQAKTGDVAQVGSRASVPSEPVGPRRLFNTAVAGALGLMVGVLGVFFIEYWRQGTPQPPPDAALSEESTRPPA
jgi:succinoglycan biosynthesis transport protein ExoP